MIAVTPPARSTDDTETGPQPIGAVMPKVMREIADKAAVRAGADRTHPNRKKMDAAVERWIAEAKARPDGATVLRGRISWFEKQIAELAKWADRDDNSRAPEHLRGLTVFDLMAAQGAIMSAERALVSA